MGTVTANYGFQKPTDGGDDDTWGSGFLTGNPATEPSPGLNGNWQKADALLKAFQDRIDAIDTALGDVPARLLEVQIRVGQLLFCTWPENPADKLGYGEWARWQPGRTVVGEGDNGERNWTIGLLAGNSTVGLVEANMPTHFHTIDPPQITSSWVGDHQHFNLQGAGTGNDGGSGGSASNPGTGSGSTSTVGNHSHAVNIPGTNTTNAGSGSPHNNVQPSKAAYIWQRTA
jgi:microcystin-dependent protein